MSEMKVADVPSAVTKTLPRLNGVHDVESGSPFVSLSCNSYVVAIRDSKSYYGQRFSVGFPCPGHLIVKSRLPAFFRSICKA